MNCEKIRDIILTDYIDNELDAAARKETEDHLGRCAGCRAFRDSVMAAAAPFRKARQVPVPGTLWFSLREGLERERRREEAGILTLLRRGWINAAAVAAMLIGTLLAGNYLARDIWAEQVSQSTALEVAGNLEMNVFNDMPNEQVETVYNSYEYLGG
ncbi:MAG: anti-sigma factor family protein [Endomicrobiales bacterium]